MNKLFIIYLKIVSWSSNLFQMIIIIKCKKPYNCFQIISIRLEYLKPYNCVQIICFKNSYLKL